MPAFALKLKALREAAGLTQAELARKTGLHLGAVFKLEQGRREPTWATVQLLAAALAVDFRAFADPNVRPPSAADVPPCRPRGRPKREQAAGLPPAQEKPKRRKPPRPRGG